MPYNFEKFTAIGGSFAQKVSIRNTGALGLSQGVMRKQNLTEGHWYAVLYFDEENKAIGIRFTEDGEEDGAIRVQRRPSPTARKGVENWSGHISCLTFRITKDTFPANIPRWPWSSTIGAFWHLEQPEHFALKFG